MESKCPGPLLTQEEARHRWHFGLGNAAVGAVLCIVGCLVSPPPNSAVATKKVPKHCQISPGAHNHWG